jgi:NitT/TauT family transport system permease protein
MTLHPHPPLAAGGPRFIPNVWDVAAFALLIGAFVLAAHGVREVLAPLAAARPTTISLSPEVLPEYALRTTLRMFAAMAASLAFTFSYGALCAKSRRAERILVPLLDILQSVPILGFLSFTVAGFVALFPGRMLGAECAAVFAIFTSQAWNMAFSFYQSLRTVPKDLDEACRSFRLSGWQRFWRLEVPFAMPGLVWNAMMSMSGGWFFVVASEAITVGERTIVLPGIGSYVALAIERGNLAAVGWALAAMFLVIFAYDQLLFRPLVTWAEKFRSEQAAAEIAPRSWALDLMRRARLFGILVSPLARAVRGAASLRFGAPRAESGQRKSLLPPRVADRLWDGCVLAVAIAAAATIARFVAIELPPAEIARAFGLGCLTLLRVAVLIALASLVWVPVGVWIGLRPRLACRVQPLAQFLAAFPANLIFPLAVLGIVRFGLDPDVWLSPLMVLGTQWYILFNVVAGASAFPSDLREAAASFRIRDRLWWRKVILPGIFPYFVTGGITASGGSWNASIVAEVATWGDTRLAAHGIGAYIATATQTGDTPKIVLGIAVLSLFVIVFNRLVWRPMYGFAARRLRLD